MTKLEYGILNISAHPHPDGVYPDSLRKVSGKTVNFWGDQYARITAPIERREGFYQGRILIGTQINLEEPAIDFDAEDEVDLENVDLRAPEGLAFNGRIFFYTLRERDHKLFIECRNEHGKRLSIGRAQRFFSALLVPPRLGVNDPVVDVTAVPDDDTVEKILNMSKLRKLEIHQTRPNPDEIDDEVAAVLDELDEERIKKQETKLTAVPGPDGLAPSDRTKLRARVASTNGHVVGKGKDQNGEAVDLSTKSHPKIIRRQVGDDGSILGAALSVAREVVLAIRRP